MNTLGFDFKDTWLPLRNLSFALRLGTQENLYAPDPAFMVVREDADIDRIGDAVVSKLRMAASMRGGYSFSGDMA